MAKMHPCKHLDYDEGRFDKRCKLRTAAPHFTNVRFWDRSEIAADIPGAATSVQFCKLHGRVNAIFDCYEPGTLSCYEAAPAADGE